MARQRKCDCGSCARCKHREYMRAWYWRNRDRACETARATRVRHQEKIRAADRERGFRPMPELKRRARRMVKSALDRGELVKRPCESCGEKDVQAHHDDYTQPLTVRWLCTRCHGRVHRREVTV